MIKITNLHKSYSNHDVLKGINLSFERHGLVVVYGPSGCGKTTLFNCIAGLLDFDGAIEFDGMHIERFNENMKAYFRLKNIGFVFQDFKLFNNDSTYNNVIFPLDVSSSVSLFKKNRKAKDLLSLVGLDDLANKPIKNLSGGEKQRVAIARALANDPKIILADEPTGSLDANNSKIIMDLLAKISQKALVIVISHSMELTKNYADEVVEMKDGLVVNHFYYQRDKDEHSFPLIVNEYSHKKPSLPSLFLFKHTLSAIKERKWRTLFCNFITSLGLIGVGLAITISSSISTNIKEAYSSIMGENKIVVSTNSRNNKLVTIEGGSYIEAIEISKKYPNYIQDIGVVYENDFYNFFPDDNYFYVENNGYYFNLPNFDASHINEFKWLDNYSVDIYPNKPEYLNDDEIVLGLNFPLVQSICYQLHITRSVESLADYILSNDLYICFVGSNLSWQYENEELFLLKGFCLEIEPSIYHTNHLWNEYVLENRMKLPFSSSLSTQDRHPWTLKKLCYFEIRDYQEELLSLLHSNIDYEEYIFELGNMDYFPLTYDYDTEPRDVTKLLFLINTTNFIHEKIVDFIIEDEPSLSRPLYGNSGSYLIMPSAMMTGFINYAYFSFNQALLDTQLNIYSTLPNDQFISVVEPEHMLCGHYSKSLQNGVNFNVIPASFRCDSIDEVYVSSGFLEAIKQDSNIINLPLYFSYQVHEHSYGINSVIREYRTCPLFVKGIIEDERVCIFQNVDWLITYFQSRMGISIFSLQINSVAYEIKEKNKIDDVIKKLNRDFPEYEVVNPLASINKSVDEVCNKLEIGVFCFSIIATLISTILLAVCNYLHTIEIKQDIGLSRCVGITKKESIKFLLSHSVIMCLISFFLSVIEIVLISFVTSESVAMVLKTSFSFSFNPMAIVVMFALSLSLSILTTIIVAIPFLKLSPLEQLKH